MPVTKKNKLYIVHQPPKSGEQGTILLKGADLRIEDGISNRYIRIKRTMEKIKKSIVPIVKAPQPTSMEAKTTLTSPMPEVATRKSLRNAEERSNNEVAINETKDNNNKTQPGMTKKRKRVTNFNPNQLKGANTMKGWILQDYFHETEKQFNIVKLLPAKVINFNPPTIRKYDKFKFGIKSATSRIASTFEEILKKIKDALDVKEVQYGLSWLEAVTFEIFSTIDEIFKIHSPFACAVLNGLMYTWERVFEIGSMIWDVNRQPKFTKSGDINWKKSNHQRNLLFLRFSDNNLAVKPEYIDMFRVWYSQAFYTLQAMVWRCHIQNKNDNNDNSSSINGTNSVDKNAMKDDCINKLVETVTKVKAMKP